MKYGDRSPSIFAQLRPSVFFRYTVSSESLNWGILDLPTISSYEHLPSLSALSLTLTYPVEARIRKNGFTTPVFQDSEVIEVTS